jgi:hypothetical protein
MVTATILKRAGLLGAAVFIVVAFSCQDFGAAIEECKDAGTCFPDEDGDGLPDKPDGGGKDDGGTADSGTADSGTADSGTADSGIPDPDAGTELDAGVDPDAGVTDSGVIVDAGTDASDASVTLQILDIPACASGLCLRHEYTLGGPYEFQGLWGSSPEEVFLAARARPGVEAPVQVVRFSEGRFSAASVDAPGFRPSRLLDTGLDKDSLAVIAGPNEEHRYGVTASEVLRWVPESGWQSELSIPRLGGQAPAVQDIWVSQDGGDVWITLRTSYVLRKHDGAWSVVHLPVEQGFLALQVEGFDTPAGDLWITGIQSYGSFYGTIAYHYERQEP